MIEIKTIYELLGYFISCFASFIWVFLLVVSLYDSKTRQEQQIKRVSLLFFATVSLGCLFPILTAYFPAETAYLEILMFIVIASIPIVGYHLVWSMTQTGKMHTFNCVRHYILPLVYGLLLMVAELFETTSVWVGFISERLYYAYLIVASLFALCYLLLSLIRIRKYWRALDQKTREGANAKRWYRFIRKVVSVTTLSVGIILFPQNTTLLFAIHLTLMLSFIFVSSYLCYCSVFMGAAQLENKVVIKETKEVEQQKKSNRRIAKVSKNANGRMAMEPLTRKRFEEYMRKQKPYLDPNLKMTDLEEALSANRTVISNFVNCTYGMNFNRYINHLRIKEVERLQKLTPNKKYTLTELVRKAGFNATRNYSRALAIENGDIQNEEELV